MQNEDGSQISLVSASSRRAQDHADVVGQDDFGATYRYCQPTTHSSRRYLLRSRWTHATKQKGVPTYPKWRYCHSQSTTYLA